MHSIDELVKSAADMASSDIHIMPGVPAKCRVDGEITDLTDSVLTPEECMEYARELAGPRFEEFKDRGELDLGGTFAGHRVRINIFLASGYACAALRILSDDIPDMEDLGLPRSVFNFPSYNQGIVLVTGETGSGKSTTLASVLKRINETRHQHIITLEDPIEYVHHPDKCIINQREIGRDTRSFANGLRAALREDPDVILVGELRDNDTIETALTAAETGHLVFSTIHTNSATDAIDRIVGVFPEGRQQQIRLQLSTTLKAVVSQQLLLRASGHGRVLACEVMILNNALQNLIREGKTPQMRSFLISGGKEGNITMDRFLLDLVSRGIIQPQTAIEAAADRAEMRKLIGIY